MHCEASDGSWKCWEEVAVSCKFRGKYLEVCPLGVIHVFFPGSENHYTFPKVSRGMAVELQKGGEKAKEYLKIHGSLQSLPTITSYT